MARNRCIYVGDSCQRYLACTFLRLKDPKDEVNDPRGRSDKLFAGLLLHRTARKKLSRDGVGSRAGEGGGGGGGGSIDRYR
jgi:hypothetical protein